MKKYSNKWLCLAGGMLYVIMSIVDRFISKIPDYIYIPLAIIGIIMIFIGAILLKRKVNKL